MISKLVFFPAYDSTTGSGHLNRLIAFAEQMEDTVTVEFIFASTVPRNFSFPYQVLSEGKTIYEEINKLKVHVNQANDALVLDGYRFDQKYQKVLRENIKRIKLILIDDFTGKQEYADIVINHAPGISQAQYNIGPSTSLLLGLDYIMLRKEFLNKETNVLEIEQGNVFICFGGLDENNLTEYFAEIVVSIKEVKSINIVLGSDYSHSTKWSEHKKINIFSHLTAQEMKDKMEKSQLLVLPSSTLALEALMLNRNMISIITSNNQQLIHSGLADCSNVKTIALPFKDKHKTIRNLIQNQFNNTLPVKAGNHYTSKLKNTILDQLGIKINSI